MPRKKMQVETPEEELPDGEDGEEGEDDALLSTAAPDAELSAKEPVVETTLSSREIPVKWWPEIRQGICEFCGVLDSTKPSHEQYKLCPHYKNLSEQLRCLYCPRGTEPEDMLYGRKWKILERTDRPGRLLIFCDDIRCVNKFYSSLKA